MKHLKNLLLLGVLFSFCAAGWAQETSGDYNSAVAHAVTLLNQGKPEEAKSVAGRAIQQEPQRYEAYAVAAEIAYKLGASSDASNFLARAQQLVPPEGKAKIDRLAAMLAVPPATAPADLSHLHTTDTNVVAIIKTTEGDMVIAFWPNEAPKTVANFEKLASSGFYDGTAFHRVIKGFMIQGGDPNTKDASAENTWGQGGPGYNIDDEFNDHSHVRGVISMANTGAPNSSGSQFFICSGSPTFLDHHYTAFGHLIKGDDVLEKIANTPTHAPDRPDKRIGLITVKIVPASSVQ
jgi:peptidyl-prolyl cis-trans isomerase B (cyclophilin B)